MREIGKLALRLFLFTVCAGLLLALTNEITKDPIQAQTARREANARKQVLTEAVDFEKLDCDLTNYAHLDEVYVGRDGDEIIGYTFSLSPMGFKAEIDMTLGVDARGAITALTVDSQSETAGLGTKIADDAYLRQYFGQAASSKTLSQNVDAISGATVSSRAVLSAVNEAVRFAEVELGIVGQENRALAEDKALTEDDIRRVSMIDGGRTITALMPYAALGYPAIAGVYEVYVKGDTAYVFDMATETYDFSVAVRADGTISQVMIESECDFAPALTAYEGLPATGPLTEAEKGVPEDFTKALWQALHFYNDYLAGEGDA